jgi:WD40 repeat protein
MHGITRYRARTAVAVVALFSVLGCGLRSTFRSPNRADRSNAHRAQTAQPQPGRSTSVAEVLVSPSAEFPQVYLCDWSQDGNRLLVSKQPASTSPGTRSALYLVDLATGTATDLGETGPRVVPQFSHADTAVVQCRYAEPGVIYESKVGSDDHRALYRAPGSHQVLACYMSPNDEYLAVRERTTSGQDTVVLVSAVNGSATVIGNPPRCRIQGVFWSPDSKLLAWDTTDRREQASYVTAVPSLETRKLPQAPHSDPLNTIMVTGGWAPDSRRLVFCATDTERLRVVSYDTQAQTWADVAHAAAATVLACRPSPSSASIAVEYADGDGASLCLVDWGTGKIERLLKSSSAAECLVNLTWSADGRRLAFQRFTSRFGPIEAIGALSAP